MCHNVLMWRALCTMYVALMLLWFFFQVSLLVQLMYPVIKDVMFFFFQTILLLCDGHTMSESGHAMLGVLVSSYLCF